MNDEIQEICIARMIALRLNPNQVAARMEGRVSRQHVADYLTRRKSMGSHKLQHLLPALGLCVIRKTAKSAGCIARSPRKGAENF